MTSITSMRSHMRIRAAALTLRREMARVTAGADRASIHRWSERCVVPHA